MKLLASASVFALCLIALGAAYAMGQAHQPYPSCPKNGHKQVASSALLLDGSIQCYYVSTYGKAVSK